MTEIKTPLSDKDYAQILKLPLDTVINPAYAEEYQIVLAEALSLSNVMTKQAIPTEVVNALKEGKKVYSKELAAQATKWNEAFAIPGMIDAIHELTAISMTSSIRMTSGSSASDVRKYQLSAAAQAIGYAYIASI